MAPSTILRASRGRFAAMTLAATIVVLAIPSLAIAAPTPSVANLYATMPDRIVTGDGTFDFSMQFIDVAEPSVSFNYWEPGSVPATDPSYFGFVNSIRLEGSRVIGEMLTLDPAGELIGLSPFSLEFTPTGPATEEQDVRREGNRRTVTDILTEPMHVSGTFTVADGPTFAIEAAGVHQRYTVVGNNPASTIYDGTETFISASWDMGGRTFIFRFIETAITSESYAFVLDASGELAGAARPKLVDGRIQATYDLLRQGRTSEGSASVDVTVATVRTWSYFETGAGFLQRVVEDEISVRGSFVVTLGGETFELDLADAAIESHQYAWHGVQRPIEDDGGGGGEG